MSAGSHLAVAAFLAPLGLCACDAPRRPTVDAPAATAGRVSPDTVVRRVVRNVGSPSAIQRATGIIAARRVGQPLDSVLAVRILDVRGDELSAARVDWQLRAGASGARLTVENDVTDSAGVSRATFIVGRSASTQVVVAEVPNVGAIEFSVVVPVASVNVEAPGTLWSGEEAVVSATLRDSAGSILEGGRVQWATTDSSALHLARSDSQRVLLAAELPGSAEVWAWSGNARGTAAVVVRPVLDLTVSALDDSVPRVEARLTAPAVARIPGTAGHFRMRVDAPPSAEINVDVDPADAERYHPARIRVVRWRDLQPLRILLIPRRWRVESGRYAGQDVAIDAEAALTPVAGRAPFWRMSPLSGRGPKTILGWHPSQLPIAIAFDRSRSTGPVTAADSTAFWDIARAFEADMGMRLFRAATLGDPDAVRVEVRASGSEGHTFTSSTGEGNVNDGTLLFRAPSTLRDPHVVTHELVHLIGFGHTRSWASVGVPSGGREARLTPQDVAYMQLAMRLRAAGMTIGFPRLP